MVSILVAWRRILTPYPCPDHWVPSPIPVWHLLLRVTLYLTLILWHTYCCIGVWCLDPSIEKHIAEFTLWLGEGDFLQNHNSVLHMSLYKVNPQVGVDHLPNYTSSTGKKSTFVSLGRIWNIHPVTAHMDMENPLVLSYHDELVNDWPSRTLSERPRTPGKWPWISAASGTFLLPGHSCLVCQVWFVSRYVTQVERNIFCLPHIFLH